MANLPWNYHQKKEKRKVATKEELPAILIVCEGEKTEPNYFKSFNVNSARVQVVGDGMNTKALVEETAKIVKEAKKNGKHYDEVWCVFDKDDFPDNDFNTAIDLCGKNGFMVAYSNQSFELWYLLHFIYCDNALSRSDYTKKLSEQIGTQYRKNSKEMFNLLLSKQDQAIKNAKKLVADNNRTATASPAKNNPVTTVYLLVERLNQLSS
jgi:hypothetical protein